MKLSMMGKRYLRNLLEVYWLILFLSYLRMETTTINYELIVDETPSFAMILGRKPSMYNGRPNSARVADGVWVYANSTKRMSESKLIN